MDGKAATYPYRKELYDMGFRFQKRTKCWSIDDQTDISQIEQYKEFVKRYHLKIQIYDQLYTRNSRYRKTFFDSRPPQFRGKYFCSYCGSLLRPDEITVDHIISVQKAKTDRMSQMFLNLMNISDINDIRNLAPACMHCNARKSSKGGLWIIRGFLGRHALFWYLVFIMLMLMLAVTAVCMVIYHF